MGRDKARLKIYGKDFVDHLAIVLSKVTQRISTVGSRYDKDIWKLPNVPDKFFQWGALGGLHAALSACETEWTLVVACDLPFVTEELFKRLAVLRGNYDAVVPIQSDRKCQPLSALYRTEICLNIVEELITNAKRRPLDLLEKINTRFVEPIEWSDLTNAEHFFKNINTPKDYERMRDEG